MIYRIYVRWAGAQQARHRSTTHSPAVAEAAYREIMLDRRLWCCRAAAVLSLNGRQLEYRRFDRFVPVAPDLAEQFKRGEIGPGRYNWWCYQIDGIEGERNREPGREWEDCEFLNGRADAPIIDPSEPIKLFHDRD